MKKRKIFLLLTAPALLLASCKEEPQKDNTVYHNVNVSNSVGFSIDGINKIKDGDDYSFKVVAAPYFDISNITVYANSEVCNNVGDHQYLVSNVTSDLLIDVVGAKPEAIINIPTQTYYFEIGKVPGRAKNNDYYLQNVTAKYQGYSVYPSVDISGVNFEQEGIYSIKYFIANHSEVSKNASVVIYSLEDPEDVTIDVGYTKTKFIDSKYGEAFLDFDIYDSNNKKLTSNDIQFDSNLKFNYLTKSYLSKLSLGEHVFKFKAPFESEVKRSFTLNLIDKMEPQIDFESTKTNFGYYKGEVKLPGVAIREYNLQNIEFKYYVDGENLDSIDACNKKITEYNKNYTYSIKVFKDNVELTGYSKNYNISLVEDGDQYFSFKNNCDGSGDGKGGFASISLSSEGNYVLNINDNGSGDTNFYLKNEYLRKYNTEDKDYVFIILKVLQFSKSGLGPSIWHIDAENCKDISNPKDAVGKVDYTGTTEINKGSMLSIKLKIDKTTPGQRETKSNNLIFRDLIGRFEIVKVMFRNYGEKIPYYDALYSDIGSFSEYVSIQKYIDSDFTNKESFFVKSSGEYIKFEKNKLFTEMQNDGKNYLSFDIEIKSLVEGKKVLSIYGAHGGGAIDISSSISLDENGRGKVVVDLTEHYFNINDPQQYLLDLTLYGSTMSAYDEHLSITSVPLNREEFLGSSYFVSNCTFKISNFEFLHSKGE